MNKIVFATNNLNKLSEIRDLVSSHIQILSLNDISCIEDLPETRNTLEGNASQKANYIYNNYGLNCFSDDTGLEIDAIDGNPGVYSARYAGIPSNSINNIKKVLTELDGLSNRSARFRTIISLIFENEEFLFEGVCKGLISKEPIGDKGFGYDPIFIPDGYDSTFAEMNMIDKSKISHRGKAVRSLLEFLDKL